MSIKFSTYELFFINDYISFRSYYKSQQIKKSFDIDSEAESVSDSEFDAYLAKTEVDGADGNDDWALDFAEYIEICFLTKSLKLFMF